MSADPKAQARPACRLYHDGPLASGQTLELPAEPTHYLRHVLRLSAGAQVALFNGRDGEWSASLLGFGKGWCQLTVGTCRRAPAPEPDLWLLFAPIRRARIDFLAEKATELGGARLQPVLTRRTVMTRVNIDRLAANAREAAEQCERLTVPEVAPPLPLASLLSGWDPGRRLIVCAEAGGAPPLAAVLAGLSRGSPLGLLTGPEGGFAPDELALLVQQPFVTMASLGPRILRAETAALAALALAMAIAGDGDNPPPDRAGAALAVPENETSENG